MIEGKLRNMATIYIKDNDKMLLLERIGSKVVNRSWCGIGGHFKSKELNDAKACVLREMKEEIGLKEKDIDNLALRYIALRVVDGELRLNYYFFADLKQGVEITKHCPEGNLEWVELDKVNEKEMPFTAQKVLEHYLVTGINTNDFYSVSTNDEAVNISVLD